MVIPDPFSLKTVNNFNSSPPFRFDIFNRLIYHSRKQMSVPLMIHQMRTDLRKFTKRQTNVPLKKYNCYFAPF